MGLETYHQEAEPGRLNAVGTWRGHGDGESLMFNGHVDTNPVTEGWTVDPWGGVVRDGFIFGIGVSNMKAGCMAYLQAVEELQADGYRPRGDVVLTYVVGELQNGIGTHSLMNSGLRTDHFVNCEPTDLQALTAHAGAFNFQIDLFGSTRHVSKRDEGVDAIMVASEIVPRLNSLRFSGSIADEHQRMIRCHVGVLHAALGRELNESRPPQVADHAKLLGT
ncbi:MAG TPA: M20/M25/M40 family metallo-hydrolase, partial [Propionibacteriaceae bacterium]|nr:M20/M25/M40 family metallo-hydrolase [Propionibacteriaceae bacterium]